MTVPVIAVTALPVDGGHDGARPLVLGPGLGTTTAIWDRVRPLLAAAHPLFAWDLPGHGASPAATEPFTMGELARGIADALGSRAGSTYLAEAYTGWPLEAGR